MTTAQGAVTTAQATLTTAQEALTTAEGNASTHASGKAALVTAASTAESNLEDADDPNDKVVTGTAEQHAAGTGGVTDFNRDGIVTLKIYNCI